jgi:exodeoxyribonuclease III
MSSKKSLSIISWNVNGLRSLCKKQNPSEYLNKYNPDILCLSETKLSKLSDKDLENYLEIFSGYPHQYFNVSEARKGYAGTAVFSKIKPSKVMYKINNNDNKEGRVITCEFEKYYLVNVYTVNAGQDLKRLDYRVDTWDVDFRNHILKLQKKKPVIVCGDLNCAHEEIDIHAPKRNRRSSGFTDEERYSFSTLLKECNLIDIFRKQNKDVPGLYTYFNYRFKAREKNKGWRIDYFLIDKKFSRKKMKTSIQKEIVGSDHVPITLEITNMK